MLKRSRWRLLKRPENLSDQQTVTLNELLRYNLRSVRAYLLREDFQQFWEYRSPAWSGKFLDEWCSRVMRSRLEPLKKVLDVVEFLDVTRALEIDPHKILRQVEATGS